MHIALCFYFPLCMKPFQATYHNNIFSRDLLNELNDSTKSFQKRPGYKWDGNSHHLLSKKEKYLNAVSQIYFNLSYVCDQMELGYVFIRRFPNKQFYHSAGIDELDYIQYHLDTLIHKIHTTLEIMKLLVNCVYQLNILPKDCSWDNLCKKISRKSVPMRKIDAYFKAFGPIIERRHISSHRGQFKDEEVKEIDIDYARTMYKMVDRGYDLDERLNQHFPKFLLDFKIQKYKKSRRKEVLQLITANDFLLHDFLISLSPELHKRIDAFEQDIS
jgi:hypothetical protein